LPSPLGEGLKKVPFGDLLELVIEMETMDSDRLLPGQVDSMIAAAVTWRVKTGS
jgi:hypothetical protein